jgi:Phosphorylated CTD interacting factor 1 WW domain
MDEVWNASVPAPPCAAAHRDASTGKRQFQFTTSLATERARQSEARALAQALREEAEAAVEQQGEGHQQPGEDGEEAENAGVKKRRAWRRRGSVLPNAAFEAWQFAAASPLPLAAEGEAGTEDGKEANNRETDTDAKKKGGNGSEKLSKRDKKKLKKQRRKEKKREKRAQKEKEEERETLSLRDPLLPETDAGPARKRADAILSAELQAIGIAEADADRIVSELGEHAAQAAQRVREAAAEDETWGGDGFGGDDGYSGGYGYSEADRAVVRPSREPGAAWEVALRGNSRARFALHEAHLAKLRVLFTRWTRGNVGGSGSDSGSGSGSETGSSLKPCRFFGTPAGCRQGQACPFSHEDIDPAERKRRADAAAKQTPCSFFASGRGCRKGDACPFLHSSITSSSNGSSSGSGGSGSGGGGNGSGEAVDAATATAALRFEDALFCLLARYEGLQGGGFQAAINEEAFDVLLHRFGVDFELFSSPLNSRYGAFCSAFPDVDFPFGSCGSFFDFDPTETGGGSFEANPPFVSDVVLAMINRMEMLLARVESSSDIPLSFTVVVPTWSDTEGWNRLHESRFMQCHLHLFQQHHGYTEGKQWMRKSRWRIASFDTSVFFLQNAAAAEKWPVTEEACDELREAFASKQIVGGSRRRAHDESGGFGETGETWDETAQEDGPQSAKRQRTW